MQRSDLNLLSEAYNNINYNSQLLSECKYYWNNVPIEELYKSASDEVITELLNTVMNWGAGVGAGVKNAVGSVVQNYKTGRDNALKTRESEKFKTKTFAAFKVELERVAKILGVANYQKLTLQQLDQAMTFPAQAQAQAQAPAAPAVPQASPQQVPYMDPAVLQASPQQVPYRKNNYIAPMIRGQ